MSQELTVPDDRELQTQGKFPILSADERYLEDLGYQKVQASFDMRNIEASHAQNPTAVVSQLADGQYALWEPGAEQKYQQNSYQEIADRLGLLLQNLQEGSAVIVIIDDPVTGKARVHPLKTPFSKELAQAMGYSYQTCCPPLQDERTISAARVRGFPTGRNIQQFIVHFSKSGRFGRLYFDAPKPKQVAQPRLLSPKETAPDPELDEIMRILAEAKQAGVQIVHVALDPNAALQLPTGSTKRIAAPSSGEE